MTKRGIRLVAAVAAVGGVVAANAVQVDPASYSFVPGSKQGTYSYADEGGTQLTDGIYGPSRLRSQEDAVPYVGWQAPLVTINFNFAEQTTFNSVTVSSLQAWIGNIALPDVFLYSSTDGQNWTQVSSLITPESSVNNYQKGSLTLSGLDFTTEFLQIQLGRNNIGKWIFVDEIDFDGFVPSTSETVGTNVPEVSSTLALLGLGMSSLVLFRRRKS
jgi:hypothetical protein